MNGRRMVRGSALVLCVLLGACVVGCGVTAQELDPPQDAPPQSIPEPEPEPAISVAVDPAAYRAAPRELDDQSAIHSDDEVYGFVWRGANAAHSEDDWAFRCGIARIADWDANEYGCRVWPETPGADAFPGCSKEIFMSGVSAVRGTAPKLLCNTGVTAIDVGPQVLLQAGSELTAAGVRCRSLVDAVECVELESGHGFRVELGALDIW